MGSPRLRTTLLSAALLCTGCGESKFTQTPLQLNLPDHSHVEDSAQNTSYDRYETMRRLSIRTLQEGIQKPDPESQLLAVFGAGISADHTALPILLRALDHPAPQIQVAALNFLANWHHDVADSAVERALGSPYLITRLEAARFLAGRRSSAATHQLEALMAKAPKQVLPAFPHLYALIGNDAARNQLKRLMNHEDRDVRLEAILTCARSGYIELLPMIRVLATHLDPAQQEACCAAFEAFGDESALEPLDTLVNSRYDHVRLAAHKARLKLGVAESRNAIEDLARNEDLFAIQALSDIPNTEDLLASLLDSSDSLVKMNAAIALLEHQDIRCLDSIAEILLGNTQDLGLLRQTSPGRALIAWKLVPSASSQFRGNPYAYSLHLHLRQSLLHACGDLPEEAFIPFAHLILQTNHWDLVPSAVALLENRRTPHAIALLQQHSEKLGSPFVRWSCTLALYKMGLGDHLEEKLLAWVDTWKDDELIQFETILPWDLDIKKNPHQLTPIERSRLLVETFEVLAQKRHAGSLAALQTAVENRSSPNRFPLAGLLLRASQ